MAFKSYELFVGPNPKTGILELEKLMDVTLKHYESATIEANLLEIRRGGNEKLAKVTVRSDLPTLEKYMKEIKKVLHLEKIDYHQINKFKTK